MVTLRCMDYESALKSGEPFVTIDNLIRDPVASAALESEAQLFQSSGPWPEHLIVRLAGVWKVYGEGDGMPAPFALQEIRIWVCRPGWWARKP